MPERRSPRDQGAETSADDVVSAFASRGLTAGVPGGDLPAAAQEWLGRATAILGQQRPVDRMPSAVPGAVLPGLGAPQAGLGEQDQAAQIDRLRRSAYDLIETVLGVFSPKVTGGEAVPLLKTAAPARAGTLATVNMRVTNESSDSADVNFYCTNLISDNGYEIPSLRVAFSPHTLSVPPGGEVVATVTLSIPQQAPPGVYTGLVQVSGMKEVRAVVVFNVV
jgi:hypothetical protein